ncbi:MAG: metallophosphoesterase, partial [Candidatus Binatia bacterium]
MSKFFWKHFFSFLLLFVALSQWACLWWLAREAAAMRVGASAHLLGPCGFYLLNRVVLARALPRRPLGRIAQRWYTAIAFTSIFGAVFLVAAGALRAVVMIVAGYALGASEASMAGLADLADGVTTAGLAATALLMAYGYTTGQRRFVIRHFGLAIAGLETGPEGLRLVQLSDIHLGRFMSAEQITDYVARANALRPDLVVITGDITDGLEHAHETFPALGRLEARLGVYAILGNHDLATGGQAVANALAAYTTIRVLRDECVRV